MSGEWNRYLETQVSKMRKAFREAPVPIHPKVETVKVSVFSLNSYCADVNHTSARKDDQLDAIQPEADQSLSCKSTPTRENAQYSCAVQIVFLATKGTSSKLLAKSHIAMQYNEGVSIRTEHGDKDRNYLGSMKSTSHS